MANEVNLPDIEQGAAFKHSFFWYDIPNPDTAPDVKVPILLDTFGAKMQLRSELGVFTAGTLIADWSTANNKLTLVGNEIKIFIPPTEVLTYDFAIAYYDLLIWPLANVDDVTRLVQGTVGLSKGATQR